jgi:phosphoesterase RecJ-like protein
MDFRLAKRFLKGGDHYLISTHINADGDAIGSILALARMVEIVGKSCRIVLHDREADLKYRFLAGFDRIAAYSPSDRPASYAILVDTPNLARIGDVARLIGEGTRILNIDHHASNARFGEVNLVDEEACATSELVFGLAKALRLRIDAEMAAQLYTGIMFDTGRFRYSSLRRAFPAAAALLHLGADPASIAEAVYSRKSSQSVKVLGEALASLEMHFKDRVALMTLPHRAIRSAPDLDGIVDYAISISGVSVAGLLKEQRPSQFRVSLRSRGAFDVNDLARDFEGGGHPNASGCCIDGDAVRVKKILLKAIRKRLR